METKTWKAVWKSVAVAVGLWLLFLLQSAASAYLMGYGLVPSGGFGLGQIAGNVIQFLVFLVVAVGLGMVADRLKFLHQSPRGLDFWRNLLGALVALVAIMLLALLPANPEPLSQGWFLVIAIAGYFAGLWVDDYLEKR